MRPSVAADTGSTQERTGLPSSSTVQVPHSAIPQPNFGPFTLGHCAGCRQQRRVGSTDAMLRQASFTRKVNSHFRRLELRQVA